MGLSTTLRYDDLRITICRSLADAQVRWIAAERDLTLYGFQTFDWLSTWVETIGAKEGIEPLIVFVATPDERVVMLLPLGIRRSSSLLLITGLGGDVTDYHAPIVCAAFATGLDTKSFTALWSRIVSALPRADMLMLEKVPATIEGLPNPLAWLPGIKRRTESHALQVPASIEAFWRARSAKLLADTKRQRRRLAQVASLDFSIATQPAEIQAVMRTLVQQKARRYQETGVPNLWDRPGYLAFYERISVDHASTLTQIASLRVGDKIVATHLGMIFRNRFYYLIPAYEGGEWARYSAGRILMEELLTWSIANRLTTFDLTTGNEPYKRDWADQLMTVYDCIYPITLKGKLFALCREGGHRGRYYLHRLLQKFQVLRRLKLRSR